jgi:hypothetical protein
LLPHRPNYRVSWRTRSADFFDSNSAQRTTDFRRVPVLPATRVAPFDQLRGRRRTIVGSQAAFGLQHDPAEARQLVISEELHSTLWMRAHIVVRRNLDAGL